MRSGFRATALAAMISFALAGGGQAETTLWKTVGWWDISFYPNAAGCSAFASYDGGISFFLGLDGSGDEMAMEVLLFDEKWKSIEEGKDYEVKVAFGNETPWTLDMTGRKADTVSGLRILIPISSEQAANFADEFMRSSHMEWTYEGVSLGRLGLDGSRQAFSEAIDCTKSYQEAIGQSSDPFSGASPNAGDPFQQ